MRIVRAATVAALASGFVSAAAASAQPMGSFRWQLQPYCNILTLAVVQQGGQYQLDGTDDQCGAAQAASARGLAFQNPNGSIGFGLTIVTAPGGRPVHVDATIALSTLGGTWRDSAGNNGTLAFTIGGGAAGGLRPVPSGGLAPGSITTTQIAAAAVTNAQMANNAVTGANVVDGSLTTADVLGAPRANSVSGDQDVPVGFSDAVYRTLTLTAPTSGRMLVTSSGYFDFGALTADGVRCSISAGTSVDYTHLIIASEAAAGASYLPFSSTRSFNVTAGSFTVNLVCNQVQGAPRVGDSTLTAIFIGS
jgi:hypothetical protein